MLEFCQTCKLAAMFTNLADGRNNANRQCDLLILGAGPAGITVALEAAAKAPGLRIIIAEAGGLEPPSADELALYSGESAGSSRYSLTTTRLRYFGGTSGHWGGWCRPLDAVDFAARPQAGSTGWPINKPELAGHYAAAHRWLEIPDDNYDPDRLETELRDKLIDFSSSDWFQNRLFHFSPPTRFGTRYRDAIEQSSSIECLLNAAAIDYSYSANRLSSVRVGGLHGHQLDIQAGRVVIAMGGLECARHLLLMRQRGWAASGISSAKLAHGFADHFGLRPGILQLQADRIYQRTAGSQGPVMPIITPTPEALSEQAWQNTCMLLDITPAADKLPSGYTSHQALGFSGEDTWTYSVQMILEPRTNENSRVELSGQTDALGLPKIKLFWEIDPRDYQSAQNVFTRFTHEIARMGLGRGQVKPLDITLRQRSANGTAHHMGTARMAEHPGEGVVDRNLKVFGTGNLYVAGSAVFPSFGYSNPTMTIVALAHRLAEHLTDTG